MRYEKGVLKPLEPVDFEEGEELVVVVRDKSFYKLALSTTYEAKRDVDEILEEVRKRGRGTLPVALSSIQASYLKAF